MECSGNPQPTSGRCVVYSSAMQESQSVWNHELFLWLSIDQGLHQARYRHSYRGGSIPARCSGRAHGVCECTYMRSTEGVNRWRDGTSMIPDRAGSPVVLSAYFPGQCARCSSRLLGTRTTGRKKKGTRHFLLNTPLTDSVGICTLFEQRRRREREQPGHSWGTCA